MRKFFQARHEKHYKNSTFHLVADITFVLIIIFLLVAYILILNWKPKMNIILSNKALSEQVKSGNLESFELTYEASKTVTKNSLAVNLPSTFILTSAEPAGSFNESSNTFYLSDLEKGSNGKIKLTGLVLGALNAKSDFGFIFNCDQCFGGVIWSLPYEIKGSVLEAQLSLPDNVYRGVEFNGSIKIKNNGPKELTDLKIKINDTWQVKGGNEISLDNIAGGVEQVINFSAVTSSDKSNENFSADYYLNHSNQLLKQGNANQNLIIKIPNFKVFIEADKTVINAEEEVTYLVNYQNQEDVPLTDIKFGLVLGNANFKISNWSLVSGTQVKEQNNVLSLTGALAPEQGGQFKVKVKYVKTKATANQEIYFNLNNNYTLNGQTLNYNLASPKTKVVSQLKIKSGAYYYSFQGDQLGVGPLPPQVGMATNY
ncbi:hypothetical protein COT98_00700, partial [Candidatus Falkowbacteria bacterium CG10_big_fil_rev_8_21_14_0_10_39_9]